MRLLSARRWICRHLKNESRNARDITIGLCLVGKNVHVLLAMDLAGMTITEAHRAEHVTEQAKRNTSQIWKAPNDKLSGEPMRTAQHAEFTESAGVTGYEKM